MIKLIYSLFEYLKIKFFNSYYFYFYFYPQILILILKSYFNIGIYIFQVIFILYI